ELRRERELDAARLLGQGVVQGLDAEPVSREHEAPALRIPQGEGEHAAQLVDEVRAVLLVEVDDDLGVAPRGEPVPLRLEPPLELLEVVDLAVEDDLDGAVLVPERL